MDGDEDEPQVEEKSTNDADAELEEAKDAVDELKIEDFSEEDEVEDEMRKPEPRLTRFQRQFSFRRNAIPRSPSLKGTALSVEQAMELKTLILGSAMKQYPIEWTEQLFELEPSNKKLWYGLVQRKSGTCGVLASVQAYMIVDLFHGRSSQEDQEPKRCEPRSPQMYECLSTALAKILWKIGHEESAAVAVITNDTVFQRSSGIAMDGITEHINFIVFDELESLKNFISILVLKNSISYGVIPFLYSCILTKGYDAIVKEMDDPKTTLIGAHYYCTQEMVNLLLTGRAHSNVFDCEVKCDTMVLKGITKQATIGFLSLFEHYNSCKVGAHYKNPLNPVWVVLSESHFTVLFAKKKDFVAVNGATRQFDLYYYDGLIGQEDEIKLTITLDENAMGSGDSDEEEPNMTSPESGKLSPLELVIRTRWPRANIDWNGAVPIL